MAEFWRRHELTFLIKRPPLLLALVEGRGEVLLLQGSLSVFISTRHDLMRELICSERSELGNIQLGALAHVAFSRGA